jgi:demethoxyubiquinone hydroxylase (CLK1/Coq7/Cat5 family)
MQTNLNTQHTVKGQSADKLVECLRGELSAVETYEQALKHITHVAIHHSLQEILTSHARRVELIRDRMMRAGVEIPGSSGAWGAFAKAVQAGADLVSQTAAVAALEAGEDRGIRLYSMDLEDCDADTRNFITTQLLPEQQRTHDLCRTLKDYMKQPS